MKALASLLMTFTIVLCSVVQYHHHDCEGNIFIYTLFGELEVGFRHIEGDDHAAEERGHHHHHDGHCGDSEDCSMHLDQLTAQEKDIDISPEETILCVAFINYILPVWHIPAVASELIYCSSTVPLPPAAILPAWLMRGPPVR